MKLTLAGLVQQPFERTQEPVDARSTFRIVTIDGGKTLNAELSIPRLCLCRGSTMNAELTKPRLCL
jgi:hypothetical protein